MTNEWQPGHTAPKDGTTILGYWVYDDHQHPVDTYVVIVWQNGDWSDGYGIGNANAPDFWMPLPEKPKETER